MDSIYYISLFREWCGCRLPLDLHSHYLSVYDFENVLYSILSGCRNDVDDYSIGGLFFARPMYDRGYTTVIIVFNT